ncbi:MAG: hypothetical protein M0Z62_03075 [Actinomycetota bacterium]|nr:hypothetical protein [Actinomycetota bacterium]
MATVDHVDPSSELESTSVVPALLLAAAKHTVGEGHETLFISSTSDGTVPVDHVVPPSVENWAALGAQPASTQRLTDGQLTSTAPAASSCVLQVNPASVVVVVELISPTAMHCEGLGQAMWSIMSGPAPPGAADPCHVSPPSVDSWSIGCASAPVTMHVFALTHAIPVSVGFPCNRDVDHVPPASVVTNAVAPELAYMSAMHVDAVLQPIEYAT